MRGAGGATLQLSCDGGGSLSIERVGGFTDAGHLFSAPLAGPHGVVARKT